MAQHYFLSERPKDYEDRILSAFAENEFSRLTRRAKRPEDMFSASEDIRKKCELLSSLFASLSSYYTDKSTLRERSYASELSARPVPYSLYRLQMAFLVATRAFGTLEEIVASLLLPIAEAPSHVFSHTLEHEELLRVCGEDIRVLFSPEERKGMTAEAVCEAIDARIFAHAEMRLFERIMQHVLTTLGGENASHVRAAYAKVLEMHEGKTRRSGEPYIFHPLAVALALIDYKVSAEALAAALLHDTIEQTEYTLEDVGRDFNENIRAYVGAVTHISSMKSGISTLSTREIVASGAEGEIERIYADALRRTFESRPSLIAGLYIKAADRLVNLRTLDALDRVTKYTKISQTKEIYLPLFRSFRLGDLSYAIESEILRIEDPQLHDAIDSAHRKLVRHNATEFATFREDLSRAVAAALHDGSFTASYRSADYTVKEIIEALEAYKARESFAKTAYFDRLGLTESERDGYEVPITKRTVKLKKLYLILTPQGEAPEDGVSPFIRAFMAEYARTLSQTYLIESLSREEKLGGYRFVFADEYENRVELFVMTYHNYMYARYGETLSSESVLLDERRMVKVTADKTDVFRLPLGATVLDLAFARGTKLALCTYAAQIDGKEVPLSHKLKDGDDVSFLYGSRAGAEPAPRAVIDWFGFVETEKSRGALIHYFKGLLYGDAARNERVIRNDVFLSRAEAVYESADPFLKRLN